MNKPFQIFPAIDLRGGQCVRLKQGDYAQETIYDTDPAATAERWQNAGGTFLHLVDLDGAKAGQPVNTAAVEAICARINIPTEIGGGIRCFADVEKWFACGVARVIVGTAAIRDPELLRALLDAYDAEKIVLGLDAKDGMVAVSGWTETSSVTAIEIAQQFAAEGIRHIIFTDIATDGMMSGPNLQAMKELCDAVPEVGIIASGGVTTADDVRALRRLGCVNLEGAIVGRAIYENPQVLTEMLVAAGEPLA